jgi:hypothetical protein
MAIREGAWDCPSCGRKKNRGSAKFCPGCGAPRGEGIQFYLPDDAAEVVEAEALARAQAGPDWICAFCETDNPADASFCTSCGASKEGGAPRAVVEHQLDQPAPQPAVPPVPPVKKKRSTLFKVLSCGCLLVLFVLALAIFVGDSQSPNTLVGQEQGDITVYPAGYRWERTVEVQAIRNVTKEAWEGEVPQGAKVISSRRDVFRTDQVQTGTEARTRTVTERVQTGTEQVKVGSRDLGNGYFEDIYEDRPVYDEVESTETYQEPVYRQVPIYRMRYRFTIDEWQTLREEKSAGEDLTPYWPETGLGDGEREGERKESYTVIFRAPDGETFEQEVKTEAEFLAHQEGRPYRADTKFFGGIKQIVGPAGPPPGEEPPTPEP